MEKKQKVDNVNANSQQPQDLKQYLKDDGEVYIVICDTECRVCELVWEAFYGEIPEGYIVTHIDGDKTNNRLDNLKLEKLH